MAKKAILSFIGGTGKLGLALSLRFAREGHTIIIGTRTQEKGDEARKKIEYLLPGSKIKVASYKQAAAMADLIFFMVPHSAQEAAAQEIGQGAQGKIVVTAVSLQGQNQPKEMQQPVNESTAVHLQKLLGAKVTVVAAFQNISADHLKKMNQKIESHVLIYGDDKNAVRCIVDMTKEIGLNGVCAGSLDICT